MSIRSLATITTAPESVALTTLERVKAELGIETDTSDDILRVKILEASSDIESHLGRSLARAGVTERFWGKAPCLEYLTLGREPVASIESVTVDDVAVEIDEVRLDPDTGVLYRLDASSQAQHWSWCRDVVIVYAGGYDLPGVEAPTLPTLPPVLEAAALELLTQYWTARGRDPSVRSEEIPGLGSASYWVGAVGEAGELPPTVMSKIGPFRRRRL